jgi:kynurenine formamidase
MIPAYDELPRHEALGLPHSWGILDPDLGTLSLTSPTLVADAAARVTTGECLPLNLSLGLLDPPLFGRAALAHSVHEHDRNTFEDELTAWNPQAASQWDGFRHVRAREAGFYGGITDLAAEDHDRLSIEHFARRGIAGRGVLLDVVRWCAANGRVWDPFAGEIFDAGDLARVAADQGVELRTGEILCIRLGWVGAYRALDAEGRAADSLSQRFSGIRSDEATARFLWDNQVAAVCTDNPAIESAPGNREDGSLHRRLLPMLGVVMGELLDLDTLADRCAASGRYDFLFVAVPLPVPGGLSSPANAMAII